MTRQYTGLSSLGAYMTHACLKLTGGSSLAHSEVPQVDLQFARESSPRWLPTDQELASKTDKLTQHAECRVSRLDLQMIRSPHCTPYVLRRDGTPCREPACFDTANRVCTRELRTQLRTTTVNAARWLLGRDAYQRHRRTTLPHTDPPGTASNSTARRGGTN